MEHSDTRPVSSYVSKLMLLESIVCFHDGNSEALAWLEQALSEMALRWEELDERDRKK